MLKPEAAQKQLEQWRIAERDEFDADETITRFAAKLAKLPARLAQIAFGLYGLTEKGAKHPSKEYRRSMQRRNEAARDFDRLPAKDRIQILGLLFPRIGPEMNRTWENLRSAPYTTGWEKRAFRAPGHPTASLAQRREWLTAMLNLAEAFQEDQLTPAWLAAWAPHIQVGYYDDCQKEVGCLLATVIDAGGRTADEVFQILCESARNEHDVGAMGRHVTQSLLLASRPDGWELVEKLLLAAQRQEGLRQTILETVDLTHPEAYRRILRVIREHDLARFSAVVRAVNVWFGFSWDAASTRVVNEAIDLALTMLEDPAARTKALKDGDPHRAYFALWAAASEDACAAIPLAGKLLDHKAPEMRFVACAVLGQMQLDEARAELDRCLEDEDLRIVRCALFGVRSDDDQDDDESERPADGRFEKLELVFQRVPEKPRKFEPIVWPWTEFQLGRTHLIPSLIESLGTLPPTRLLPYVPAFDTWQRRELIDLFARQKKWDPEARAAVIGMVGDSSADVREAAFEAIARFKLTGPEVERLESMLTRKAADLRNGVLGLILNLKDDQVLASSDRLLAAKDASQRHAGLELLRQMFAQNRSADSCRGRVDAYRAARPKLTKDEQTQVSAVLDVSPESHALSLDNALGLMDPAQRPPAIAPKKRKVDVFTDAAIGTLKSLDDLIHQNREKPIVTDRRSQRQEMLGTIGWAFPSCNHSRSPEAEASRLPLLEVWETWWKSRPKSQRDADGLELWRARQFLNFFDSWDFDEQREWAQKNGRGAIVELLRMKTKPPKLKYDEVVDELLDWLTFLHPTGKELDTLLDISETLLAAVPEEDLKSLVPAPKAAGRNRRSPRNDDDEDIEDWRDSDLFDNWIDAARNLIDQATDAQFTRLWNLLHWLDQPVPGARRRRTDWNIMRRACRLGLANAHEVADHLIGPRGGGPYGDNRFESLAALTARKLRPEDDRLLREHPEIADLVARCRASILDIELQRGDTPTVVTAAVEAISSLEGTGILVRILSALGKSGFKMSNWYSDRARSRAQSLTSLAKVTYPGADETPASCVAQFKAAVKEGAFPEERLIELAFLAPQWVKIIEAYFQWKGMAEALYWFLAHMSSWGSDVEMRAAEGAGMDEDESPDAMDDDDDDDDLDDGDEPAARVEKPRRLSPWERLILERTSLTEEERSEGAIDVAWFRRVHSELGAARWKQLAQAARFAANAGQARKAQLLADVLLGEASLDDLIKSIRTKYLKEHVRLFGLFPLPTGARRDAELKRRFDVLQEYGRYAKTLSGLTKPEALRSLQIGLRNLAGTAGYPDPIRLEWALGADAVKDLSRGPVAVTRDGVTVTLTLDDQTQPQMAVSRGSKPLKSAPPAIKKDKAIAALYERSRDLKRQASRQRQSLEGMMCRGEAISAAELVSLCDHALVAPLLRRLVLAGDGILGYPDKNGKALRDHAGKLEPVKKSEQLRIAHPYDLFKSGAWDKWQHDCFQAERVQPFKQVFRELYVVTRQEKSDGDHSQRYAGQQVNPRQAYALWGQRGWNTDEGVFKTFHDDDIIASVSFDYGITTPGEVEGLTISTIQFLRRGESKALPMTKVPPRLFSEAMRDIDLVVSVAHAGGVDPEATASTVEMRTSLLRETCQLLSLKNVRFKGSQAVIEGQLAQYTVHLGSGTVHRMPGGALCIVPVHSQHRGRLFLPFADDDPRTAEVMSKVLMLARDQEIQDPTILDQLRA